ncbi:hypothetical protein E2I00_000105, partial [Balaenoptera physalus]
LIKKFNPRVKEASTKYFLTQAITSILADEEVLTKPHYKKSAYSSIGYIAIALLNLYMINLLYITNHNPYKNSSYISLPNTTVCLIHPTSGHTITLVIPSSSSQNHFIVEVIRFYINIYSDFFGHPDFYILLLPGFRIISYTIKYYLGKKEPLGVGIDVDMSMYYISYSNYCHPHRSKIGLTEIVIANSSLDSVFHDTCYAAGHFHYILSIEAVFTIIRGFAIDSTQPEQSFILQLNLCIYNMKYHLIHRFISLTAVIPVIFIIRQAFTSKQEVSVVELTTSNLK